MEVSYLQYTEKITTLPKVKTVTASMISLAASWNQPYHRLHSVWLLIFFCLYLDAVFYLCVCFLPFQLYNLHIPQIFILILTICFSAIFSWLKKIIKIQSKCIALTLASFLYIFCDKLKFVLKVKILNSNKFLNHLQNYMFNLRWSHFFQYFLFRGAVYF